MKFLKKIRSAIRQQILAKRYHRISVGMNALATSFSKGSELPLLTSEEKKQIRDRWGKIIPDVKSGYIFYQIFKKYNEFDSRYVPSCYYHPYITSCLNPQKYAYILSDKNILQNVYHHIKHAKSVIRNIDGLFLDESNNILTTDEAIDIIKRNRPLIIKKSIESCGGKNITIINSESTIEDIKKILKEFNKDFVIQELVKQSEDTKRFNPSSLNTIRITSLFINGKFSICNAILRCGSKDSIVDNGGMGGTMVRVGSDGKLGKYGLNFKGEKFDNSNGIKFEGQEIHNFDSITKIIEQSHTSMPLCGIIGWDISLDEKNEPILIEANLTIPGVFGEQLCCGNMFGDRTDEIIEYIQKNERQDRIFF